MSTQTQIDLRRLGDFFSAEDIEWKPIAVSKKTGKGLAAAYVDNRAIMDRLDEVCGPENWRNEFREGPDGGVVCGLSIRCGDEWVTKWDGAENTDIEAVKGGLSSAMRRAAVQWGIGRYLYRLPQQWVPVDERGRFRQPPRVPSAFLPPSSGDGAVRLPAAPGPSTPAAAEEAPSERPAGPRKTRPKRRTEKPRTDEPPASGAGDASAYFMPF